MKSTVCLYLYHHIFNRANFLEEDLYGKMVEEVKISAGLEADCSSSYLNLIQFNYWYY